LDLPDGIFGCHFFAPFFLGAGFAGAAAEAFGFGWT
jgi:hypothetical protein